MGSCGTKNNKNNMKQVKVQKNQQRDNGHIGYVTNELNITTRDLNRESPNTKTFEYTEIQVLVGIHANDTLDALEDSKKRGKKEFDFQNVPLIQISKQKYKNDDPFKHHLECIKNNNNGDSYDMKIGVPVLSNGKYQIEIEGSYYYQQNK